MTSKPTKIHDVEVPAFDGWFDVFRDIADCYLRDDFELLSTSYDVSTTPADAQSSRLSVNAYGENLAPMQRAGWTNNVMLWDDKSRTWTVLVYLWVEGEQSDLVVDAKVHENEDGTFAFRVGFAHVM